MKCKKSVALLVLAFTLILVPAVSAQPNNPIRLSLYKMWVGTPPPDPPVFGDHWEGTISGAIEGSITVEIVEDRFTGDPYKTEHYYDTWEIVTDDGSIWGYYEGMYNFKTRVERVHGRITYADGAWSHLVGCIIQARFSVTYVKDPVILHEGMFAEGTLVILPKTG